jgi:hypothetical protein
LAFAKGETEVNIPFSICSTGEAFNEAVGHRLRLASAHQKAVNAKGPVDTPPAVAGPVHYRENVTWKQRCGDGLQPPRVPTIFPAPWYEYSETLVAEVMCRT